MSLKDYSYWDALLWGLIVGRAHCPLTRLRSGCSARQVPGWPHERALSLAPPAVHRQGRPVSPWPSADTDGCPTETATGSEVPAPP
ncbi:hypothetical protein CDAR_610051 [Caerostris darwini]|uniref:Uncharacterized protein n=1 Tax=Caerostris darwini TaxID=1538125 RepID=A0AAV4RZF5_9ARAC|nr:hypothetical protein CDAR_610051 [Caerostris darwini]